MPDSQPELVQEPRQQLSLHAVRIACAQERVASLREFVGGVLDTAHLGFELPVAFGGGEHGLVRVDGNGRFGVTCTGTGCRWTRVVDRAADIPETCGVQAAAADFLAAVAREHKWSVDERSALRRLLTRGEGHD